MIWMNITCNFRWFYAFWCWNIVDYCLQVKILINNVMIFWKGLRFFVLLSWRVLQMQGNVKFVFSPDVSEFQNPKGISGFQNPNFFTWMRVPFWWRNLLICCIVVRRYFQSSDGNKGNFQISIGFRSTTWGLVNNPL